MLKSWSGYQIIYTNFPRPGCLDWVCRDSWRSRPAPWWCPHVENWGSPSSNQRAALRQWTNERPECWASMSPQEASSPHIALPTEITLRIYTNYTNWSNENILNVTSCITGRCEPIENVYFISFLCRFYIFHRWILFVWTDSLREDLINLGLIIIYKTCN